jgi:hypothetical protein
VSETVVVRAASAAQLNELVHSLQADDIDQALVEFENREVAGQLGEPITVAILVAVGTALGTGAAAETGRRSAAAVLKRLAKWHMKHKAGARYAKRDESGTEWPISWEEAERLLNDTNGQAP